MKVYIDSANDILYSSFYIKGIIDIFGKKNIYYKNKYFKNFKFNNHFLALIIDDNQRKTNIIIDYADGAFLDKTALDWSDFYLKINIDENIFYNTDKLVSIGPSFGIKFMPLHTTLVLSLINFIKSYKRLAGLNQVKRFFSNYKAQLKRPKITDYISKTKTTNYVFFTGSLWKKEKKTNMFRANFIKSCIANKKIRFEGGFAPRINNDIKGFEQITLPKRISMKEYMTKIHLSMVAFNTPAVLDCHGWKLGEFLCLGKAIISTPLTRRLPENLIDGKHYLITDGTENDINSKINELSEDLELLNKLQENSKKYFYENLSPERIALKIKALHNNN
jgi:glycosyltransferase involved in cell wall biosynthesis